MDKYTVDLDQVLNDFEYSELTDQHSKNVPERPQSNVPFHPPPVTKHSINNVFHSLNEYLNSEINGGSSSSSPAKDYLLEDAGNLGINENKLSFNTEQVFDKAAETQNSNVNTNLIDSLDNTFQSISINDQLKHEDINQNEKQVAKETSYFLPEANVYLNNSAVNQRKIEILSEIGKDVSLDISQYNTTEVRSNYIDVVEQNSNLNEKPTPETLPEQISVLSDTVEKVNVDSFKTEIPDFSSYEEHNVEAKLLPELSCTESFVDTESIDLNKEIKCDRNGLDKAEDKADRELEKEGVSHIENNDANSDIVDIRKEIDVNIDENNDLSEDRQDMLIQIEDDSSQSITTPKKYEDFVIEPSKSPYAFGVDVIQEKPEVCEELHTNQSFVLAEEEETKAENNVVNQINEQPICETVNFVEENIDENREVLANDMQETDNIIENSDNLVTSTTGVVEDHLEKDDAPQKIVGFSTDVDIDENELNKMLEDLDLEEDSELPVAVPIEEITTIEEHLEVEDNLENINTEDMAIESMRNKDGSEAAVYQRIEDQESEPEVTRSETNPQSNDEPTEKIAKSAGKAHHPQMIECLEMEKPINKRKKSLKTAKKSSKEAITTVQKVQDQKALEPQSEVAEKEVTKEELPLQKEHSQESLSRPQNLPLNNELKGDNVGRKINLIGSPGSTPYNNAYVNKSIESKIAHEAESDYTSSASPTFSDCSTESTSTASTVSVENVPNNADKFVKKSPKNTNVENEAREAAESKGAGDKNVQENVSAEQIINEDIEGAAGIPEEGATNASEDTLNNAAAGDSHIQGSQSDEPFSDKLWLGKEAPLWIPDADAAACLHCEMKFTVLKRRHHCRACGLVLCSKCCNLKFRLEYMETEARVCNRCYCILNKETPENESDNSPESGNSPAFRPNPNNPLEYCSTVSPLQQTGQAGAPPPSVMVPVGVLKRTGSNKKSNKSVMFCDGIAPGSDLTFLDKDFNYNTQLTNPPKNPKSLHKGHDEPKTKHEGSPPPAPAPKVSRNHPKVDQDTGCYIPKSETSLPPTVSVNKTDSLYSDCSNTPSVVEMLKNEALVFAITQNLFVHVKVINMSCCINKQAWCFCTEGLIHVGSDEVVYLIEYIDEESFVPKDVFFHVHNVYVDAVKGTSIKELGLSLHNTSNFLDSKNHAGFVYIKPTFQCLENVVLPKEPYLIGILIHRWETPWAKLFPLRLILRLGAEYRYYPSPLISSRHRDSVFVEIGHTIINLLADFRNFTYTLPQIRGLVIHMEDKKTTITIPKNRYDQVMKSISNSSDHILAFAGNFSPEADSHLVCIQDTQGNENVYTTHAINIHNKPRKVTGASFIVFNGSLKSSSGLTAKSNIVEDGLMIQIPSEHMDKIRDNLRNMKNHTIACGCINATSDESVNIVWGDNDSQFNIGVKSPVDLSDMKGVPSIRVHNGKDYLCNNGARLIRWTEVFILQNGEENPKNQDPVDISKVSESIAKACCTALVKYLDLLVSNSCQKIGIRATLHVDSVSYSAGSNGLKLPPIYMRSLDNELVPVLHRITSNNLGISAIVLELIFRILNT